MNHLTLWLTLSMSKTAGLNRICDFQFLPRNSLLPKVDCATSLLFWINPLPHGPTGTVQSLPALGLWPLFLPASLGLGRQKLSGTLEGNRKGDSYFLRVGLWRVRSLAEIHPTGSGGGRRLWPTGVNIFEGQHDLENMWREEKFMHVSILTMNQCHFYVVEWVLWWDCGKGIRQL